MGWLENLLTIIDIFRLDAYETVLPRPTCNIYLLHTIQSLTIGPNKNIIPYIFFPSLDIKYKMIAIFYEMIWTRKARIH